MSGYEHDHEHGHFVPHSHPHRHQGERATEAHERSGMGAHHHKHPAADALRAALAEALRIHHDHMYSGDSNYSCADAILAHPAVVAALAGSGPEAGLREAAQRVMDSHRQGYWVPGEFDALSAALAATPAASPTDPES